MSFLKNSLVGLEEKTDEEKKSSVPTNIKKSKIKNENHEDILNKSEKVLQKDRSENGIRYCHKCGAKLSSEFRFCYKCGTEIKKTEFIKEESKKEKDQNNSMSDKGLPIQWFKFYVYIRTPLTLLLSAIFLFGGEILALLDIGLYGVLFYGMHNRKVWAWKYNFFILCVDVLARSYDQGSDIYGEIDGTYFFGFLIGGILIWLLPNWIYFKKRKYLFVN